MRIAAADWDATRRHLTDPNHRRSDALIWWLRGVSWNGVGTVVVSDQKAGRAFTEHAVGLGLKAGCLDAIVQLALDMKTITRRSDTFLTYIMDKYVALTPSNMKRLWVSVTRALPECHKQAMANAQSNE